MTERHSPEENNLQQLITEHIDLWTGAVKAKSSAGRGSSGKRELYGIKKLRELILELAVRGKLVAQDPNDEPASVLLERIVAEKAELVKQGKIKKTKTLPKISEEEKPFELPEGWEFGRLGNIGESNIGLTYSPKDISDSGIPVLRSSNIQNNKIDLGDLVRVNLEIKDSAQIFDGDLLICARNGSKALVGKTARFYDIGEKTAFGAFMAVFRSQVNSYIEVFLNSPVFRRFLDGVSTTTINQITQSNLIATIAPIPPLAEQHRIVAKVDELMALCDQLEQQTESSLDAHQTLVQTLLDTLLQSANAEELEQNWQRLSAHFDLLFTTEQSIDQLKQTILQLAVMGKLVPQDPNDEPASELLKRIAAEKEELVKQKKIKKQKPLPPISDNEKPFQLPKGWEWCRADDICYGITSGSTPPKTEFSDGEGIPYLKVYNIRNQKIDFEYQPQFVNESYHMTKLARSILKPGDVVMNIVGPPLGKIAIIPSTYDEWNCNQAIVFFRTIDSRLRFYIYQYLVAGVFLNSIELIGTAGQDNISVTKSRSIVIPMPPLPEQNHIVAKVDQLMALCDQLKAKLADSKTTQLNLADALVAQAM